MKNNKSLRTAQLWLKHILTILAKKQHKSNALICYPIFSDFFFPGYTFPDDGGKQFEQMEIVILLVLTIFGKAKHLVAPDIINQKQNAKNEKTLKNSAKYFQDFCLVMSKQSVDK